MSKTNLKKNNALKWTQCVDVHNNFWFLSYSFNFDVHLNPAHVKCIMFRIHIRCWYKNKKKFFMLIFLYYFKQLKRIQKLQKINNKKRRRFCWCGRTENISRLRSRMRDADFSLNKFTWGIVFLFCLFFIKNVITLKIKKKFNWNLHFLYKLGWNLTRRLVEWINILMRGSYDEISIFFMFKRRQKKIAGCFSWVLMMKDGTS